jgi:hypothetical protein
MKPYTLVGNVLDPEPLGRTAVVGRVEETIIGGESAYRREDSL